MQVQKFITPSLDGKVVILNYMPLIEEKQTKSKRKMDDKHNVP